MSIFSKFYGSKKSMVELGDRVRDKVTGFTGIANSRTEWLNKCVRVGVQPEGLDKDDKIREAQSFDIEQLEVVTANAIVVDKPFTGGPARNDPKRATLPAERW